MGIKPESEEAVWRRQLTQIVETVAAGVVVFDPDGRIVLLTPRRRASSA